MFDSLFLDLRFALRQLRRRPGFTAAAVLTLGLGIGANGAIFSVVNGVLLRPLPYGSPDQLAALWHVQLDDGDLGSVSWENFADWRDQVAAFQDMAAFARASATITADGATELVDGARVTENAFTVLGVAPELGRGFTDGDAGTPVVVLGHGLFVRAYGGDPSIVGRTVRLGGSELEVLGVMPAGFRTPHFPEAEFWRPMDRTASCGRGCWFLRVVGRLAPGATLEDARSQLGVVAERLASAYPDDNRNTGATAVSLHEQVVGDVQPALLVLLAGVGLVLSIACANVANLLLARAVSRGREVAVRAALGASRGRLARQLLTESVVLGLAGGLVGLYVAYLAVGGLLALAPGDLPRLDDVGVDGVVVGVMLALALGTGLLFGLVPVVHSLRGAGTRLLTSDRAGTGPRTRGRLRDVLVAAEVALAVTLLVGAGLLVKSFSTLTHVDPGFDAGHLLSAETRFDFGDPARRIAFYDALFQRMTARPDVTAAAGVWLLPINEQDIISSIEVEGRGDLAPASQPSASMRAVTNGYFGTMRIPLVRGRVLRPSDDDNGRPVAVVSETMARELWPDGDAIGQRIRLGLQFQDPEPWREVVGVVGDVKVQGLDDRDRSVIYLPYRQFTVGSLSVVLRTTGAPGALAGPVRKAVSGLDPDVTVYDIGAVDRIVAASVSRDRFFMLLLALFASLAALLASMGIYAVTSYAVGSRTRELGIRMAVGARAGEVQRMVLGRAAVVVGGGVVLGIAAALGLTRLMRGLLFQTSALDPGVFVAVPVFLGAVALLAAWLPARRAARINPVVALRQE